MSKGLAGTVVAETSRSRVDGQKGELLYHGYNILDLGENSSFEAVAYLMWNSAYPTADELAAFKAELVGLRAIPDEMMAIMKGLPTGGHPVAVLRTMVSAMSLLDSDAENIEVEEAKKKAMKLTAVMPTLVAAWQQIRNGKEPVAPRADLDHAANFLYMLNGAEGTAEAVAAVDTYLVLLVDHGFNASTFSARVTTGTLSDVYSAVTTAIGTLKGPAHGGATQKAMEQFIEAHEMGVAKWFRNALKTGRRIMGIGHRVYKVEDPRAKIFRPLAADLAKQSDEGYWFDVSLQVEQLARANKFFIDRNLFPNVDYYSAPVLHMIGIPMDQFTSMFAMSRVVGWTAHVLEQLENNRLIRPSAEYVGPTDLKVPQG